MNYVQHIRHAWWDAFGFVTGRGLTTADVEQQFFFWVLCREVPCWTSSGPVWESESDNTKFNTPAPHSHLRPCNTSESHDPGEREFLIWPNLDIFTDIYIYAFSRRFYPTRLTIAFRLYIFISTCVPWESNPQPFCATDAMLYRWATQEHLGVYSLLWPAV